MEKIKIKYLDINKVKVPKGYKVIIDPELVEEERKEQEKIEIQERLSQMSEPSDEELIELGKLSHPYYLEQLKLSELNG